MVRVISTEEHACRGHLDSVEVQVAAVVVVFLMFSLFLCQEKQDYRDSFSSVIEVS